MKRDIKLFMVLTAVFVIISLSLVPAYALAAADGDEVTIVPSSSLPEFTLDILATIAGLSAFTLAMVEATKFLLPWKLDPRIYCAAWALLFMVARLLWVVPPTGGGDYFVAFINWVIVTVAASGGFEYIAKPIERFAMRKIEEKKQGEKTSDEAAGVAEVDEE